MNDDILRLANSALDTLSYVSCNFWACPGPDEPTKHMATCLICHTIKDLRKIKELAEKELKP